MAEHRDADINALADGSGLPGVRIVLLLLAAARTARDERDALREALWNLWVQVVVILATEKLLPPKMDRLQVLADEAQKVLDHHE